MGVWTPGPGATGGSDTFTGNATDETADGLGGDDTLNGGDGADTLRGGDGTDQIFGEGGDDIMIAIQGESNSSEVYNGGSGTDTLQVTGDVNLIGATIAFERLTFVAGAFSANALAISTNNMPAATLQITGSAQADILQINIVAPSDDLSIETWSFASWTDVTDHVNIFTGGLGNDSLQGGVGADAFYWVVGDGRDTVDGGADSDTFNAYGTASADLGRASWNGTAITALMDNSLTSVEACTLDLGDGVDWLIYNATAAVSVSLAIGSASGFSSVQNVENVIGGSGDDLIGGNAANNRIDGQGGADQLDGGDGSDTVLGGDGADLIFAGGGNDSLQGQNGNDTFIWTSTDGRDTFNGGADTDAVYFTGSGNADVADANWNGTAITGLLNNALISIESVNLDLGAGGAGGDWLRYNTTLGVTVNLATSTATGFASITDIENLIGGTGNDDLSGNGGVNKINGNAGDDFIYGAGGNDNLTGGLGQDVFLYAAGSGADTINDFDAWAVGGQDFINVQSLGITAANFASRVTIIDTGADTVVRIDSDIFITLKNVSGDGDNVITISDFILGV